MADYTQILSDINASMGAAQRGLFLLTDEEATQPQLDIAEQARGELAEFQKTTMHQVRKAFEVT